ncbi:unnamed protein product [Urochloa humidicola]
MCSLARPSTLGCSDATYRRRGVMAREPPPRLVGAIVSSAARTQKRARDSLDGKAAGAPAPALPGQQRLQERMKAELDAVRALHRKAVLLCRGGAGRSGAGAATVGKGDARFSAAAGRPGPPREAPSEAAAKRRKTSPRMKQPATEASPRIRPVKQQQPPSKRAPASLPLPERKIENAKEAEERRRRMEEAEEMARAREECRRQMLAMEMAALPDETVYPHVLEELGIAPFEYATTRERAIRPPHMHRPFLGPVLKGL